MLKKNSNKLIKPTLYSLTNKKEKIMTTMASMDPNSKASPASEASMLTPSLGNKSLTEIFSKILDSIIKMMISSSLEEKRMVRKILSLIMVLALAGLEVDLVVLEDFLIKGSVVVVDSLHLHLLQHKLCN